MPVLTHYFLRIASWLVLLCSTGQVGTAGEKVEAYWGSFGERNGRIEGAFLKTANSGLFIGFDEESEIGAFSSEVEWNAEGSFVFGGVAKFKDSSFLVPTSGVGRALDQSSGMLLESGFSDSDLRFESFVRSEAVLDNYYLEGEVDGELYVVTGDGDLNYALFIDHSGSMMGGRLQLEEASGELYFRSKRGDRFEFRASHLSPRYVLADGRRGGLLQRSGQEQTHQEPSPIRLSAVWNSFAKISGYPADSLHFIVEGEGEIEVEITADLSIDVRQVKGLERLNSIAIELYQLDEKDEWKMLFPSLPFQRHKSQERSEFEISMSGKLPTTLARGTYLVAFSNVSTLSAEFKTRAIFAPSPSIGAVNGSTFYQRGSQSIDHRFGFELVGEGMAQALVRGVGPGLEYFDISECTKDPSLSIYQRGLKSWQNEDWELSENSEQTVSIGERFGAFPLPKGSKDSAICLSIGSGTYGVESRRNSEDPGFEIIELYLVGEGIQ